MTKRVGCLGIDTSCYTTSAAVAVGGKIAAFQRKLLPVPAGERGLRQSEAVFAHIKQLPELIETAVREAGSLPECVCVSSSPRDGEDSYMPVFLTGLAFAISAAAAAGIPLYRTTHQRGHIRAAMIGTGIDRDKPFLAVHLSGGTTDVLLRHPDGSVETLGTSLDLHAGQLVDRIGVRMGLPFPSGRYLEETARRCREAPKALLKVSMEGGDCHLSGCETALISLMDRGLSGEEAALEVYSVLCRTVLRMLVSAKEKTGIRRCLIAGGVASSLLLREMISERNKKRALGLEICFGEPKYSSDNAAGVALLGEEMHSCADRA
ncbi:MAG: O-sialoglycoprotein endopeptidase [Clostridia bacterium]|nr:O-sialoglycoprotein endopeptidase [Clostridia bacterium]